MKQSTITEYGCTRSPGVLIFTDAIFWHLFRIKSGLFSTSFSPMRGAEKTATGNGYGADEF